MRYGIIVFSIIALLLMSALAITVPADRTEFEVTINDESGGNAAAYQDSSWPLLQMGVDAALSKNFTGQGVRIAIIDTGIDYNHQDLKHAYKGGYDFVNGDEDPYDDNGHGTFLAGLIAGTINGSKGSLGVAPDVEIYAVKVIGANGRGQVGNVAEGVQWAIDNDVQIICMSLSIFRDDQALREKLEEAYGKGILLVAAAGNTGGNVTYPAKYDFVIAVGSVDIDNQVAARSAKGPEVEIVAPGVRVLSTVPNDGYAVRNGTSYAAAYASGILAILLSANPELDGEDVRSLLQNEAIDLGDPGKDTQYGYGLAYCGHI